MLEEEATFESLGLCDWLLTACKAMGFRRPTPVQRHCIPAVRGNKHTLPHLVTNLVLHGEVFTMKTATFLCTTTLGFYACRRFEFGRNLNPSATLLPGIQARPCLCFKYNVFGFP